MSIPNGWRSQNLTYRPIEPSHEAFLQSTAQDWQSYTNASPHLPIPQGLTAATGLREWLNKSLLGVVICLPTEIPAQSPNSNTTDKSDAAVDAKAGSDPNANLTPIGWLGLSALEPSMQHHRRSNLAITLAKPFQGQGYGSEALLWALEFAFLHANLHRVGIGAAGWNEGAVRLYERLGFRVEGRMRDFFWARGRYWDVVEMGMLDGEWRGLYGGGGGVVEVAEVVEVVEVVEDVGVCGWWVDKFMSRWAIEEVLLSPARGLL